jgi:hypothetical protein
MIHLLPQVVVANNFIRQMQLLLLLTYYMILSMLQGLIELLILKKYLNLCFTVHISQYI